MHESAIVGALLLGGTSNSLDLHFPLVNSSTKKLVYRFVHSLHNFFSSKFTFRAIRFTFFQNLIVDLVGGLAVVEDLPRHHRHVQAFGARAEVVRLRLRRQVTLLRRVILVDRVVAVARPDVNLLAEVLDHLVDRVMVVTLRRQLLLRVVRRVGRGPAGVVTTVDAALRNA